VLNLLVNALKFTPPGGVVDVLLNQTESTARIVAQDTGRGIDRESLPFVFDSYYRDRNAADTGGLGLGLSIARRLVELHGGTIEACSGGIGRGAAFTITLPLASAAALEDLPAPIQIGR
jgi:signal transduction histidine kinase